MGNDLELLKMVVSSGGISGLMGLGIWRLMMRMWDDKARQQEEINRLQAKTVEEAVKRSERLETKLDDCEKKHDEVHRQISQLREDNGLLKGKVETMGLFTSSQTKPPAGSQ